jgi:hypothetical protein
MEAQDSPLGPLHAPPPDAEAAFSSLLASLPKKKKPEASKFVKKLDDVPEVNLPPEGPIQVALSLADRALVGQFTGLWPSPKSTENWVVKNWIPLIKNKVTSYFLGRGYFLFEFNTKEDKDLIFRNGPYFMGPQGLYLNKWTPDFDPAVDVPTAVPVWVRLPNLPVHCWNWDSLKHIGDALGKFIDRANNNDQYDCARICVEVDLEVGLPEAIKIKVGSWTHVQVLDYEQLPFKCRKCHVYGHFARGCPNKGEAEKGKEDGWNQVKRSKTTHKKTGAQGSQPASTQNDPPPKSQGNRYELLSSSEETPQEEARQDKPSEKMTSAGISPEESDTARNKDKQPEASEEEQDSEESEEDGEIGETQTSVRRSARGRKSAREKRAQETYKNKLQGSQPTLEKLLDKNTKMPRNQVQGSKGAPHHKHK